MVEIALSIAIMAVGIVAVLGIMPTLLRSNRQALEFSNVAIIGQIDMDGHNTVLDTPDGLMLQVQNDNIGRDSKGRDKGRATNDYFIASLSVTNFTSRYFETNDDLVKQKIYTRPYSIKDVNPNFFDPNTNVPFLVTRRVTYSWGGSNQTSQHFTFYTEQAAKFNIVLPKPYVELP